MIRLRGGLPEFDSSGNPRRESDMPHYRDPSEEVKGSSSFTGNKAELSASGKLWHLELVPLGEARTLVLISVLVSQHVSTAYR
jgi:hypothetical protein